MKNKTSKYTLCNAHTEFKEKILAKQIKPQAFN